MPRSCLHLNFIIPFVLYKICGCELPTKQEIKAILAAHNGYRVSVQPPSKAMYLMRWNYKGALQAEKMTQKCLFEHDSPEDRTIDEYPDGGQNIFQSTERTDWGEVVKMWYQEISDFNYDSKETRGVIGHYTQIVWGTSKEVGCGMTDCNEWKIYTCNYYPAGNYVPISVPYLSSQTSSCDGCVEGAVCVSDGPYAGKLLESCDSLCDRYNECPDTSASSNNKGGTKNRIDNGNNHNGWQITKFSSSDVGDINKYKGNGDNYNFANGGAGAGVGGGIYEDDMLRVGSFDMAYLKKNMKRQKRTKRKQIKT